MELMNWYWEWYTASADRMAFLLMLIALAGVIIYGVIKWGKL